MNKFIYIVCFLIVFVSLCLANEQPKKNAKKNKSKSTIEPSTNPSKTQTKLSARDIEENNLFFEAERLKVLEDNTNAITAFEKVLSLNPNNHAAMFELARLYYISKQDDKALKSISTAVKLMPNNIWYNLVYAQILAIKDEYKASILVYDKIISLEPREQSYYYDKAGLLEATNDINKTIDFYNEIESIFGIDAYCIEQKKRLYLNQHKIDMAIHEVEKLIESDSTNPEYYNSLASLYNSNNQKPKAESIYKLILQKFPNNPKALLSCADITYQKGDVRQAINYTSLAFSNTELNIDTKINILYQYINNYNTKKSEFQDAYQLAKVLRTTYPTDAKAYAISGDLCFIDGSDSLALYYYVQSVEYKKDVYTVWQQILLLSSEQQKNDLLKKYSEEAIELFPLQPLPYYFNGIAMYQLKRYRDAVNVLQEAYKLARENTALKTQIYASLGDNYHEMGNHKVSDSCFEASLKLNPSNTYTLNNYAYYLSLRNNQLSKAKEYAQMAIKIDSLNPNYLDTYAWILFQLGEYPKAEEFQLKALRNSDLTDPILFEHYGDILFKNNKTDEALKVWIKAKEKGSVSKTIEKKISDKKWYNNELP